MVCTLGHILKCINLKGLFIKGFNVSSLKVDNITEVIHAIKITLDNKKTVNFSLENNIFQ